MRLPLEIGRTCTILPADAPPYLKAGQGGRLRDVMHDLVKTLTEELPKAFREEAFDKEKVLLTEKYSSRAQQRNAQFAGDDLRRLDSGCSPTGVKVAATHALLVGPAAERLGQLPIEKMYVSDSVPPPEPFPVPLHVLSLAPLLGEAIQRLHNNQSIAELIAHY